MWVVWNVETGESTEAMRFAAYRDARDFINERTMPWQFAKRWESPDPHPTGEHALGQIWRDGAWVDYARSTPEQAIAWARKEPVALARVVDWISREVMWP